jgi:hypothetical protein
LKLYFAAVGSDLWPHYERACKGHTQQVLFSFYDLELGGFQFRRKSWETITGKPYERSIQYGNDGEKRASQDTESS